MELKVCQTGLVSERFYPLQPSPAFPITTPPPEIHTPPFDPRDKPVQIHIARPERFNIPVPGLRRAELIQTSRCALQRYPYLDRFRQLNVPHSWQTGLPRLLPGILNTTTVTEDDRREWVTTQNEILFGRQLAIRELRRLPDISHTAGPEVPTHLRPMQHTRYQQWYSQEEHAWPVWGGGIVLHTSVAHNQTRITASNAFYPTPAEPLQIPDQWISKEEAKRVALQAVTAYQIKPSARLGLCRLWFQQTRRLRDVPNRRMTRLYTGLLAERTPAQYTGIMTGRDIDLAALEKVTTEAPPDEAWDIYLAPCPADEVSWHWLVPFAGDYRIAYRVMCIAPDQTAAWQVFVDAQTAAILGRPVNLALHANIQYYKTSAEASRLTLITLNQDESDLYTAVQPFLEFFGAGGVAKANVAFHAAQLLAYIMQAPPVDPTQVAGIQGQFVNTYNAHAALLPIHATLTEVAAGSPLDLAFVPRPGQQPHIHFPVVNPAGDTLKSIQGKAVRDPALDPEVIYHEFAHALTYAINPAPFEQLEAETAPFNRALLEGYATYLARSLGSSLEEAALDSPEPWAAYAYANWGNSWHLHRPDQIAGEDLLPAPNLFPCNPQAISEITVYEVGMIWARALWDIRQIPEIVPEKLDQWALQAFAYVHGFSSSFEHVAEALLDCMEQQGCASDIIDQAIACFARRGILAGRGIQALAKTTNVQGEVRLWAGSDAGLKLYTHTGANWQQQALPAFTAPGVTALAAAATLFVATEKDGLWRETAQGWEDLGWPSTEIPLCLSVYQDTLYVGTAGRIWHWTENDAWQEWGRSDTKKGEIAITRAGLTLQLTIHDPVLQNGAHNPALCLVNMASPLMRPLDFPNADFEARPILPTMPDASSTALLVWKGKLCVGTLAHGIWQFDDNNNDWQRIDGQMLDDRAVLRLAGNSKTLYAGTTDGVWRVANTTATHIFPTSAVTALTITDNQLIVGTADGALHTGHSTQNGWQWTSIP